MEIGALVESSFQHRFDDFLLRRQLPRRYDRGLLLLPAEGDFETAHACAGGLEQLERRLAPARCAGQDEIVLRRAGGGQDTLETMPIQGPEKVL